MFKRGSICPPALLKDQIVGCTWISQEVYRSVNRVQPPLREGDACVQDVLFPQDVEVKALGKGCFQNVCNFCGNMDRDGRLQLPSRPMPQP